MLLKVSGAIVLLLVAFSVVFLLFFQGGDSPSRTSSKQVQGNAAKEEVWDGRGEHIYSMELTDFSSPGALRIEKASFAGLRSARSTVVVRMSYEGSRLPAWLSPKRRNRSFAALYQNSDDRPRYKLSVGPLDDGVAVIDFTIARVATMRLNESARKGLFLFIQGPLRRNAPFFLRISASPQAGYTLADR